MSEQHDKSLQRSSAPHSGFIDSSQEMKGVSPPAFALGAGDSSTPGDGGEAELGGILAGPSTGGFDPAQMKMAAPGFAEQLPVQRMAAPMQMMQAPIQKKDPPKHYVPKAVWVEAEVDAEAFKAIATQQIFGNHPPTNLVWSGMKEKYGPNKRVIIQVDVELLNTSRVANAKDKGVPMGKGGGIEGADERAKSFLNGPKTQTKEDLMAEIDRRYYQETGIKPGTKIKDTKEDEGKKQFWNQIRDEVLFQNEYVQNLPPEVKKLIRVTTDGKPITAQDIEKLFRIAKKIESLDPSAIVDYASKINSSTKDLDVFEASVDRYLKEVAERKKDTKERMEVQDKLAGRDELYKLYKEWRDAPSSAPFGSRDEFGVRDPNADFFRKHKESLHTRLVASLNAAGFNSIAAYEESIRTFENGFQKEAQRIALDILAKYEGTLYQEGQRYKDPLELQRLYDSLGGFRSHHEEFSKHAPIANAKTAEINRISQQGRLPGNGHVRPSEKLIGERDDALAKAKDAKGKAQAEVQGLNKAHPLLKEDHLPLERRLDKEQMAKSDVTGLGNLIQNHIAARIKDVKDARQHIIDDPALVFKLDKLMPEFKARQGIVAGSVPDQIITDKIASIHRKETIINVVLGVIAVALAIVSLGTATPWIAAGAAAGGLLISSYSVIDEYTKYTTQNDLAAVGMADDPSVIWLIVSVVGAVLDMGAAVKAVGKLGGAAKALNAGGSIDDFSKALKLVEAEGLIDAKAAAAIERAAKAQAAYQEAASAASKLMSTKTFSAPEMYAELVKMAKAKLRQGSTTFEIWLNELKAMRIKAKLGDLNADEVAKARQAWSEARAMEAALENLDELAKNAKANVIAKIQKEGSDWAVKYTDDEIKAIVRNGIEHGMTPKQIEDFIFVGSRKGKEIEAKALLQQMDNHVNKVLKENLPYLFENAAKYGDFKKDVVALLDKYGIPKGKVKVQGSSLRTPDAKDVDLAVFLSEKDFYAYVEKIKKGIADRNKDNPHMIKSLMSQLEPQVKDGRLNSYLFERLGKGDPTFNQALYELRKHLKGGDKGIDISIMIDNGNFNVSPFLDF